jgi:YbbR domain-containing protein
MRYHPFRHLGLKVLSIALATLLWLSVAGEHIVERSVRVPLEFRNVPDRLEIVGEPPGAIDVRVRGSSAQLSKLQPGEIVVVVDLSGARPGARLFPVRADEIRAPFGVEIAQVAQSTVSLELEKAARRTVPVVPATQGDPAPGYVIGRISSEPATVDVAGPESHVRQVAEATTEPVVVTGARARVRDVVTVGVLDPAVRLAQPVTATVLVDVWPAPVERELSGLPVRWRNLAAGLRAQVASTSARLTVRGSGEPIGALRADAIQPFVDLAGLGPGRYNLRVQVDPVDNVGVSRIEPAMVTVTIR